MRHWQGAPGEGSQQRGKADPPVGPEKEQTKACIKLTLACLELVVKNIQSSALICLRKENPHFFMIKYLSH